MGYNLDMARYVVNVRTSKSPAEAFAFMADLTNFAQWDPGVLEATQVEGDGPGPDAAFDVTVKAVPKPLVLTYRTIEYDEPTALVAEAKSNLLRSLDRIEVRPDTDGDGSGSVVTYDAELTFNGILGLTDPLLRLAFNRIGDQAADGLIKVLDGERVDA